MNNWYLKFLACGFIALGVGLTAAWLSSFFFWMPHIQKGIGFLAAGISIVAADLTVRRKLDVNGIVFGPSWSIQIPAWIYGAIVAVGGTLLLFSSD